MRLRRAKALGAAFVAMALVATGCGGTGAGGGEGKENVLTLWHMEQPPNRVKAFQELIDRYNATNPEFKVEQQVQDWNQIYTKIAGATQSQTQPDLLFTLPDFTTYVRELGSARPVTELVKKLDSEHKIAEVGKAPYRDEEEYWAVPLYGMVQMLWYRKDLLADAGVKEAPQTWSELLAAAEKLTKGGQSGIALPAGKNLATDQVIYSFMLTNGAGKFLSDDGGVNFDQPAVTETLDFYKKMMAYSPQDSANYSWGEPQAAFNSGAAAMAVEKGQYLAPFEEESGRPPSDLGCASIPQPEGGQSGSIHYSNAAMILSQDDERAAAAEKFLQFLLKPENYGDFLNAEPGLFLPLTADGVQAESWTSHPVIEKYRGCVDKMLEQSETGDLFGFVDGQYVDEVGKISSQNILAQVVQRVVVQGEDPKSAVAWGQQQMQAAVE
ncbi:ABC transporter substrate-binding protein [Amycolatopsis palatopharyngis]|uniref:ABC transporter substrate-binding protein n=1 Tax=Amycolatopsis palatopharyngis TaxID=187982 RepID=UPI000E22382D|nr:sugar ABC transporter substrate-binding protein [Amycolatopsis palatopharyngis]